MIVWGEAGDANDESVTRAETVLHRILGGEGEK